MPEPVLLYISFGPGPHVDEVIFSATTALFKRKAFGAFRIAIFTDDVTPFTALGVEIVRFEQATIAEWAGPSKFVHRRKIVALAEALRRFAVPVVMIDGDTYFRQPPEKLFERVGPGKSLMHVAEGSIGHLAALGHKRHQLSTLHVHTRAGDDWQITPDWTMWNSGVVGVDPADAALVDHALAMSDAIFAATGHINSEQIAFGRILQHYTTTRPCRDVLFHYHEWFIRDGFRKRLHGLLAQAAKLPVENRAGWLFDQRPRPPTKKKLSATLKRPLKRLGLFKSDLNTST